MLTVIEEVPDLRKNGSVAWRCICDCGNETIVSGNALRTDNTLSCGCLQSKNELKIRQYLNSKDIKFETQYWFDDLRSPITNWVLKYDFAIFDYNGNLCLLIEYDGEQHKFGTRYSHDEAVNEEKFRRMKIYDQLKTKYCEDNNIDLLRISFEDKDKVLDLVESKLIEKELIKGGI